MFSIQPSFNIFSFVISHRIIICNILNITYNITIHIALQYNQMQIYSNRKTYLPSKIFPKTFITFSENKVTRLQYSTDCFKQIFKTLAEYFTFHNHQLSTDHFQQLTIILFFLFAVYQTELLTSPIGPQLRQQSKSTKTQLLATLKLLLMQNFT